MTTRKKILLALLIGLVYLLHQDFWNWGKIDPLVFGLLPVGLAYHAAYSILASVLMAVLVRFAWPAHLERTQSHHDDSNPPADGGKK